MLQFLTKKSKNFPQIHYTNVHSSVHFTELSIEFQWIEIVFTGVNYLDEA